MNIDKFIGLLIRAGYVLIPRPYGYRITDSKGFKFRIYDDNIMGWSVMADSDDSVITISSFRI